MVCTCKEYICFIENCAQDFEDMKEKGDCWGYIDSIVLTLYCNVDILCVCYYHAWFLHLALWSLYMSHHI